MVVHICSSCTGALLAAQPAQLDQWILDSTERPCLKEKRWMASEERHPRLTSGFYMHLHKEMYVCVCKAEGDVGVLLNCSLFYVLRLPLSLTLEFTFSLAVQVLPASISSVGVTAPASAVPGIQAQVLCLFSKYCIPQSRRFFFLDT